MWYSQNHRQNPIDLKSLCNRQNVTLGLAVVAQWGIG